MPHKDRNALLSTTLVLCRVKATIIFPPYVVSLAILYDQAVMYNFSYLVNSKRYLLPTFFLALPY